MGAQGQVDAKDKAVLCGVTNQCIDGFDGFAKVFMVADFAAAICKALRFAFVLIDVNKVNVAGDIELACAKLAHADDPQGNRLTVGAGRRSMPGVQLLAHVQAGAIQYQLCQNGDCAGNRMQISLAVTVQHHEPFHDQLPQNTQCSR